MGFWLAGLVLLLSDVLVPGDLGDTPGPGAPGDQKGDAVPSGPCFFAPGHGCKPAAELCGRVVVSRPLPEMKESGGQETWIEGMV